jgi:hypothetical protein
VLHNRTQKMMKKICQTADLHWISPSQTIPSSSSADPDSVDYQSTFAGSTVFSIISGNVKINNYFQNILYVWNFKT